jgi:mannose-6-phosphate isomerase-like protein (cupin superfamily)
VRYLERKVVIKPREFVGGAPMETRKGVRDWKVIYPETGFPARTLIMSIVEIDPSCKSPLHRHNCEEVYYVLQGHGEIFSDDAVYPFEAGDAIYNLEGTSHCVRNMGEETVRLVVVGGIMFVGLLPEWPTPSPYEIFEGENPR